jgi:hypothetical protein
MSTYILRQGQPLEMGTSTNRIVQADANTNVVQFYGENTATSGDNRGIYNRFYLSGAGGGGESLRAYTTVNNVAASTAHGTHTSLSFGTSGSVSGQGVAMRGTLHIPSGGLAAGTYAAVQAEVYADGTGTTAVPTALFRGVVDGNATGKASVLTFLDIAAEVGSGKFVDSAKTALTGKAGLKVTVNGVAYGWIPIVTGS